MGYLLLLLALAGLTLVVVSYLRVSVAFGAVVIAMMIDVAAFLHFFIPTGSNVVAVAAALAFVVLVLLLVREWKRVSGL